MVVCHADEQPIINPIQIERDSLKNVIKNVGIKTESRFCPMHPDLFFGLSSVSGFNKTNGYTYIEYIVKWRIRYI